MTVTLGLVETNEIHARFVMQTLANRLDLERTGTHVFVTRRERHELVIFGDRVCGNAVVVLRNEANIATEDRMQSVADVLVDVSERTRRGGDVVEDFARLGFDALTTYSRATRAAFITRHGVAIGDTRFAENRIVRLRSFASGVHWISTSSVARMATPDLRALDDAGFIGFFSRAARGDIRDQTFASRQNAEIAFGRIATNDAFDVTILRGRFARDAA